jgi:hypothetical protein
MLERRGCAGSCRSRGDGDRTATFDPFSQSPLMGSHLGDRRSANATAGRGAVSTQGSAERDRSTPMSRSADCLMEKSPRATKSSIRRRTREARAPLAKRIGTPSGVWGSSPPPYGTAVSRAPPFRRLSVVICRVSPRCQRPTCSRRYAR